MKKNLLKILALMMVLAMVFAFSGCGSSDATDDDTNGKTEATDDVDDDDDDDADDADDADDDDGALPGAKYGYAGDDPVELAIYEYVADEIGDNYDDADACIPVVHIVNVDYTDENDVKALGDYWIYNYKLEGDTLKCVSGGDHPGCMHLKKDGDEYEVTKFDEVESGSNNEESAKQIFGEHYKAFHDYQSDDKAKNEDRTISVLDYVNLNGLSATQYQDEGWDPVKLPK